MTKPLLAIIVNMNAGRVRRSRKRILSYLKKLSDLFEVYFFCVYERGEALEVAKALIKKNEIKHILAVGGDGTVNEIMSALLEGKENMLSVLPAGTANVFARDRGIPYSLKAHFSYMKESLQNAAQEFYPGQARRGDKIFPFLQMAGTGIDAAIVAHTSFRMKKRFGALAYCFYALRIWSKFAQKKRSFMIDHQRYEAFGMIALTNRFYGGAFNIGSKERIAQDKLRFALLGRKGVMGLIELALSIFGFKGLSLRILEAESASFIVTQEDFIELDGDYYPQLSQEGEGLEIVLERSQKPIFLYCDIPLRDGKKLL